MPKEQLMHKENPVQVEAMELQPELVSMMKEEVLKARDRKMPIIRAFEAVAQRSGLKSNTIRNYYYRYLHAQGKMREDSRRAPATEYDQEDAIGRPFTSGETEELMKTMLKAQAQGESVRGCANHLAGGDKRVLIRLQNKYRSIIAREPEYVEDLMSKMRSQGIKYFNPYTKESMKLQQKSISSKNSVDREELIDMLSQFIGNIRGVEGVDLHGFFRGLRDLSQMASDNVKSISADERTNMEEKIRSTYNSMILAEARADKARKEAGELSSNLRSLMNINRQFIAMSDADKLAGLNSYIENLQSYMNE